MENHNGIRILTGEDVRKALPMCEAIEAMKDAFAALAGVDEVQIPVRTLISIQEYEATSLVMPSYVKRFKHIGVKVINAFKHNPPKGMPRVHSLMCLFDRETGRPVGLLEGRELTAIRTGAASGLATDLMARKDAYSVAILGAGVQGRMQLEAVCTVRPIRKVSVYDAVEQAAKKFADEMSKKLNFDITVALSPSEAVKFADIICTATTSRTPVFEDSDIAPGTHINAVGSFKPNFQEIPEATVLRSQLVVDHYESALAETGDLIIPMNKGTLKKSDIHAELGNLVLEIATGRKSEEQVTLFKSVGVALQDLAAACYALTYAEIHELGTLIKI